MNTSLPNVSLTRYLHRLNETYFTRAAELREAVEGWLSYVPQTFPHFTRHTVEHSDEIVRQLSRLLFRDGKKRSPVVDLSGAEAYVLIASAYLHDAGMVVSDQEKTEILSSAVWKQWTTGNGGAARAWALIEDRRKQTEPADATGHFTLDLETRYLIADFARLTHHERTARLLKQDHSMFSNFASGDPILLRTIEDVCLSHGMASHELEDPDRYPEKRDIDNDKVNVRFMALLLRLGDLLDMSYDRGCPLLLNAACPLPAGSLAHWSQYQRITHRVTSPERIGITAACETQQEHRVLQDWCEWLAREVREATFLMARAVRHRDWVPPEASLEGENPSIKIRPAAGATYVASKWKFELDQDIILDRLVLNVHQRPAEFIRELVQNALDATRCKLYHDMISEGIEPPVYPTHVDENRRRKYPIQVSLRNEPREDFFGAVSQRQVLVVEDSGIGMDKNIIEKYLLQVGRSYYTTDDFRRRYQFVPGSRFGVGFLSVFAVSDEVSVETYKPSSPDGDGPLRLKLFGPRSYLLTERGERESPGTRVEVLLSTPVRQQELTQLLDGWCRFVEFPIVVDDLGAKRVLSAERHEEFTYEIPIVNKKGARYAIRHFPMDRPGVEGELYVFARLDKHGEHWGDWDYAQHQYPSSDPRAAKPHFPYWLTCLHGITVNSGQPAGPASARIDIRRDVFDVNVSRQIPWHALPVAGADAAVLSRWQEILAEHLATSYHAKTRDAWKYKQMLVRYFPIGTFWEQMPGCLCFHRRSGRLCLSLAEAKKLPVVRTIMSPLLSSALDCAYEVGRKISATQPAWDGSTAGITAKDLRALSTEHLKELLGGRRVSAVTWLPSCHLAVDWEHGEGVIPHETWHAADDSALGIQHEGVQVASLPCDDTVGIEIHSVTGSWKGGAILNADHPFVKWLLAVQEACSAEEHGLESGQFMRLVSLLDQSLSYPELYVRNLNMYVRKWEKIHGLPDDLHPPSEPLKPSSFKLRVPLKGRRPRKKR